MRLKKALLCAVQLSQGSGGGRGADTPGHPSHRFLAGEESVCSTLAELSKTPWIHGHFIPQYVRMSDMKRETQMSQILYSFKTGLLFIAVDKQTHTAMWDLNDVWKGRKGECERLLPGTVLGATQQPVL